MGSQHCFKKIKFTLAVGSTAAMADHIPRSKSQETNAGNPGPAMKISLYRFGCVCFKIVFSFKCNFQKQN